MANFGTWRAHKSAERRGTQRCSAGRRFRWAGAAAAAAGCGLVGGADLLDAARCSSVTTAVLFVVEMLMEMKKLLQLGDGQSWQSCRVLGRGRVGCARRCAWLWTLGCRITGAFAWSLRMREQHVRMCSAWSYDVCAQAV